MSGRRPAPKRRAERGGAAVARHVPKRRAVRPRYGRVAVAGLAASVTVGALLGGVGVLPLKQVERPAAAGGNAAAGLPDSMVRAHSDLADEVQARAAEHAQITEAEKQQASNHAARVADEIDLPADSGKGRRAVFDMSAQRVWIVDSDEEVERTYLVSGSLLDNLDPGTYSVYSRSRNAVGVDDSGTMEYFVRFTQGDNAAIGFHDIPVKDGEPLQTRSQLGTPLSHGCIRQWRPDARALWRFAPVGTKVVVLT